jgi:hypothetical protein
LLVTPGAPGAYPRRKHLKGAPIGFALALPSNSKTRLERVSKEKASSLLGLVISDEGKKFYYIDPWLHRNFDFIKLKNNLLRRSSSSIKPCSIVMETPWLPKLAGKTI